MMKFRLIILLNFFLLTGYAQESVPKNIYEFKVPANNGNIIDFAKYKGKKILIVNTTSRDDHNHQYAELEAAYQKYKNKLVIIGFLTNDFATPPGSKKNLSTENKIYNVTFPLASKVLVRGEDMAPVYKWLTTKKYNKLRDNEVGGDFQKYLVNEKGKLMAIFAPHDLVTSPQIVAAIEKK